MPKSNPKYIFVVGGVMSSVGKGVVSASIAKLIQARGYNIASIKCDMYVNVDAGTIRPAEHGEVFVGEDGVEADQDLGNYERFTNQICTLTNYITTGQVYQEVIRRERNLEYGGEDVEVVPDVPKEIIRRIELCQTKTGADVVVTEFGGTVGEYQLLLFLEAARMMKVNSPDDVLIVMVSYLPTPSLLGEQKSKPTQYAIRTLNSAGLTPDFIFARADEPVTEDIRQTISNVCSIPKEHIVSSPNVDFIYEVPLVFEKQNLGDELLEALKLKLSKPKLDDWEALVAKIKDVEEEVTIGIVGKYFNMKSCRDTYISVIESLYHACWANNRRPKIKWLDSEVYENEPEKLKELSELDGIVVPGGFGERGTEGMILAAQYARENKIPYLGLCLGMQIMSIEFARNMCGLEGANSEELNPETPHPVIHIMEEQKKHMAESNYGATMRLGAYPCDLVEGTKSFAAYGKKSISERHRHRYEFNNSYRDQMQAKGFVLAGINPDQDLVEIAEIKDHPFMVGSQFHPEFKSRPLNPHPLFRDFIKAAVEK
ncbi:MAG: CTP synthase [Candidatus Uhrbacteria bacterium]|nr:CTP synthase [Patescibacteria group bacterium]MBU1906822.1 CTP synthase [Patescibacteria group bacterium]